jgi:hypothetical protein
MVTAMSLKGFTEKKTSTSASLRIEENTTVGVGFVV